MPASPKARISIWVSATHRLQSETAFPLRKYYGQSNTCDTGCQWKVARLWYQRYKYWGNVRHNLATCYPAQCYRFIARRFAYIGQSSYALYIAGRESKFDRNVCNPGVTCPYFPRTACGLFQFMPSTWGLGHSCVDAVVNVNRAYNYVRTQHSWSPWRL